MRSYFILHFQKGSIAFFILFVFFYNSLLLNKINNKIVVFSSSNFLIVSFNFNLTYFVFA